MLHIRNREMTETPSILHHVTTGDLKGDSLLASSLGLLSAGSNNCVLVFALLLSSEQVSHSANLITQEQGCTAPTLNRLLDCL